MIVVRVVLSCWPFTIMLTFPFPYDWSSRDRWRSQLPFQNTETNGDVVISKLCAFWMFSWSASDISLAAFKYYISLASQKYTRHARSTRKKRKSKKKRKVKDKCAMNDNTVLFSSLLLDACIVPVSVPVCHLDSRQLQQPPPSLMNNQQHQLQQNNPPHLAYQQANHHSYTTVTTSNQHGPSHLPSGGGVMGAHQQGPVPSHLQQQVSSLLFRNFFVRFLSYAYRSELSSVLLAAYSRRYVEIFTIDDYPRPR